MLMGELGFKLVQNDCGLRGALEVWRRVFVKEQGIAEALVFDGDDADTLHAVVSDGMKVIGAARVRFPGAGRAKLERMAVLEGWRRAGVGRRFTAFLIGELRGTGVEEVVLNLAAKANRTPDVTLDLCEVAGFIRADHWSKIIEEIVDNALKFSVSGTPVLVQLVRHNDSVVLRVTDRGRGMRPEHVAEVGAYMQFERKFYEQQGSGLGLTLARRLAELQGGRLAITSQVGVGTVVEVALPRADDSLASPML